MIRVLNKPASAGVLPFDPAGAPATRDASVSAFGMTKTYTEIANALPTGVKFNPPAGNGIIGTIKAPEWQEWNLSVQQQLNRSTVFMINYVGNHGARISYSDAWPNAYDYYGLYEGTLAAGGGRK